MNDPEKKWRLAGDLLRDRDTAVFEKQSLAAGLAELRRRRRQRRLIQWGIPLAAAAAIAFASLFIRPAAPPEIVQEQPPADEPPPSIVVTSRPVADDFIVRSRPAREVVSSQRSETLVVRTESARTSIHIVSTEPSDRLGRFTERQLLAALEGRPILLATAPDGERRLVLLDEPEFSLDRQ